MLILMPYESISEFAFLRFNIAQGRSNPSVSIAISEAQNHCHKNLRKRTLSPRLAIFKDAYKAQKAKKNWHWK